jgi:L-aminopeptidase/D-esterase-like protein
LRMVNLRMADGGAEAVGWASLRLAQRLRAELWGSCAVREDEAGANKHVLWSDSGAERTGAGVGVSAGGGAGGGGGGSFVVEEEEEVVVVVVNGAMGDLRREGAAAAAARSNASGERSTRPRSRAQGRGREGAINSLHGRGGAR